MQGRQKRDDAKTRGTKSKPQRILRRATGKPTTTTRSPSTIRRTVLNTAVRGREACSQAMRLVTHIVRVRSPGKGHTVITRTRPEAHTGGQPGGNKKPRVSEVCGARRALIRGGSVASPQNPAFLLVSSPLTPLKLTTLTPLATPVPSRPLHERYTKINFRMYIFTYSKRDSQRPRTRCEKALGVLAHICALAHDCALKQTKG